MKNLKWNRYIGFLGIGLMTGTVLSPVVEASAADSKVQQATSSYTPSAMNVYNKTATYLKKAKKTKDIKDIQKTYKSLISLSKELTSENYDSYVSNDKMDKIFLDVRDLLYKNTQPGEIVKFAKEWKNVLVKNQDSLYVYHFRYLVMNNKTSSIQKSLDDLLTDLNRYTNGIPTDDGMVPLPTEKEMEDLVQDYFDEFGPDNPDPKAPTDNEANKKLEGKFPQQDGSNITSETIHYEKSGKDWYEITDVIQDGKVIKTNKRIMSAEESYFLRVQEDPSYDVEKSVDSVETIDENSDTWNYMTSDQNPESKYTIHYTINKSDTTPYYYDTGIRVNNKKEASYEQYKDILLVLADKTGGYLVEDKNKILVVLEGKPIVVNDNKKNYSKEELESLFSKFNKVDIRIMETKIGKAGSLEEQIVSKQAKTVKVDGKNIELNTFPMVKNERALLPFDEISFALGAKPKHKKDSFIVEKDHTNVMFRLKDNSVYVNGKSIKLVNAPVYKNDVLMVEVTEMATALGYEMSWDGETSTINFDKK